MIPLASKYHIIDYFVKITNERSYFIYIIFIIYSVHRFAYQLLESGNTKIDDKSVVNFNQPLIKPTNFQTDIKVLMNFADKVLI